MKIFCPSVKPSYILTMLHLESLCLHWYDLANDSVI